MKTLTLSESDIPKGNLILVNSSHALKENVNEDGLAVVRSAVANILLERQTANMLRKVTALLGCEQQITPVSGYRTMREQQTIYEDCLREHGRDFTHKYVAIPGCSEHQTGLAADLAENKDDIDFLRPDFPYTGICGQFREVAAQYGFVERYPAGREEITHIAHEPWHFRYVGYPHSKMMKEKALTLEEYTNYLKQFSYYGTHLYFKHSEREFEVFYVPVLTDKETIIAIPDGIPYQVSGNNEDGIVVTLWTGRL